MSEHLEEQVKPGGSKTSVFGPVWGILCLSDMLK